MQFVQTIYNSIKVVSWLYDIVLSLSRCRVVPKYIGTINNDYLIVQLDINPGQIIIQFRTNAQR